MCTRERLTTSADVGFQPIVSVLTPPTSQELPPLKGVNHDDRCHKSLKFSLRVDLALKKQSASSTRYLSLRLLKDQTTEKPRN